MANDSRRHREEFVQLGNPVAMLQPIRDNAESKRFRFSHGIKATISVRHHPGEIRNFRDPASIVFSLDFDIHDVDTLLRFRRPFNLFLLPNVTPQAAPLGGHLQEIVHLCPSFQI